MEENPACILDLLHEMKNSDDHEKHRADLTWRELFAVCA